MSRRATISALGVSAALLVGVAIHEGYSDRPYLDIVGVQTIGFGRTEGVRPGEKTTPQRELVLVLKDLEGRKAAVALCVKVPLHQHELDAYMSLAYNIGTSAFCGSTLVEKLNQEDYIGACREIQRWNRAGGREVAGLTKRRQAEYETCIGKNLPAAVMATADKGETGRGGTQ